MTLSFICGVIIFVRIIIADKEYCLSVAVFKLQKTDVIVIVVIQTYRDVETACYHKHRNVNTKININYEAVIARIFFLVVRTVLD